MRNIPLSLFLLALAALPARAHFIFLLPAKDGERPAARMVFSDSLAPDNADLLERIKQTTVFSCSADGSVAPVPFAKADDALALTPAGKGGQVLFATCRYGVFQRGTAEPALLTYYAKTWIGDVPRHTEKSRTDLDIAPGGEPRVFRVLWKGKPLADAEATLYLPDDIILPAKTDREGLVKFEALKADADGLCGIRVGHKFAAAGEYMGKKYAQESHWATLVFPSRFLTGKPKGSGRLVAPQGEAFVSAPAEENAEATKLLADARAARANWENFPGFTADVEVNVEGKIHRGKVDVDDKGRVTLTGPGDPAVETMTRRQLSSIVGHRMDGSGDRKTPCAFADDNADHPLGRAIRVLNDEFHSSYRIRDRQVIVVNRTMPDSRFTIIVMENYLNKEKQFLPADYVVNSWDLKTNALRRSETFHQEWKRVGQYDLPSSAMVVTATEGNLEARKLTLSNHKLK